jgi:anti-sigma-K factor RskA
MSDADVNIEELLPFYVLGTLTAEEVERVEAYFEANPDARKWVREMSPVLEALAMTAGTAEPAPGTKRALQARVGGGRRAEDERRSTDDRGRARGAVRGKSAAEKRGFLAGLRWEPILVAASLIVAIVALAWAATANGRIAALRQEVAGLEASLADQGQVIRYLSSPGSRSVLIAGTEIQPGAQAQMIFAPDSPAGGLLIAGLPQLPGDQVYQLWLIEGETPQSAGTFSVDDGGRATVLVEAPRAISDFDAVGVSIEPTGGSPQPTGDIVLLSNLTVDS